VVIVMSISIREQIIIWIVGNAPSSEMDVYIGEIAESVLGQDNSENREKVSSAINGFRRDPSYPNVINKGHSDGWYWSSARSGWKYPGRAPKKSIREMDTASQTTESKLKRTGTHYVKKLSGSHGNV